MALKTHGLLRLRDLHGALTLEDLLEKLPELILNVLPQAERATIILPDKEGGTPVPRSSKRRHGDGNDLGVISQSIVDRAIENGEDVRAGRWWWEAPEHKECGLHRKNGQLKQEA